MCQTTTLFNWCQTTEFPVLEYQSKLKQNTSISFRVPKQNNKKDYAVFAINWIYTMNLQLFLSEVSLALNLNSK